MFVWSQARVVGTGSRNDGQAHHADRHRGGANHHQGAHPAHADAAGSTPVGAHRRRHFRQIRKSAGHELVQGARRAQQAGLARQRRPQARRDRYVGGKSRASSRLSRQAARHRCDDRDAVNDTRGENCRHQGVWRRCHLAWRKRRRGAGARRPARARAQFHPGASLRRCADHCGTGHGRARDARGRAGSRLARDPHRRRRSDFRQCHRSESRQSGYRNLRRRSRALSFNVERGARRQQACRRTDARRGYRREIGHRTHHTDREIARIRDFPGRGAASWNRR